MKKCLKSILVILSPILVILWISCQSTQVKIENPVPNPYDSDGNPLVIYNAETGKVEMEWVYYQDLIEYIIIEEELKK